MVVLKDGKGMRGVRAAEEELVSVAEERDALLPQLEEARWHRRQADKELADLNESLASSLQVWPPARGTRRSFVYA